MDTRAKGHQMKQITVTEICMWGMIIIIGVVVFKDVILKAAIDWWIV